MTFVKRLSTVLCTVAGAAALAGCSSGMSGGMFAPQAAGPTAMAPTMAPITTAGGVQQFSVPLDGRAALAQRLVILVPGPITQAQVSNGWRTAASASATPNDYAACVSATTPTGVQTFMIVRSGGATGDVKGGTAAAQICNDPNRVVQWVPLTEAMARS